MDEGLLEQVPFWVLSEHVEYYRNLFRDFLLKNSILFHNVHNCVRADRSHIKVTELDAKHLFDKATAPFRG